jgi:hypothetical protein
MGYKIVFPIRFKDFVFKTNDLNFFKSNFELDSNKMKNQNFGHCSNLEI